ncbi:hypothetical protein Sgou_42060 [Streptomyces gougerotii]|uniref:Uncharacterized protein n=2 Tax=Streptomyces diastaticus group TaxID=2849069 RepID=A0A8H9HEM6_9ACTN|nr:hypothetical protein Srut_54150 [Streptomyces rutgersensis]GFH73285.1 hypothetical protein Sdia_40530 [Streptomyces diastaticus subsp. diastaticus]GFH79536.1 hypothetical protein Sgou_42060 [Streptomyces gougerotii]GGU10681.1 hypothetical protein GCM10015534_11440 [Streptomyces diastaticus subsp. diastaticus]GGU52901.1 hypothetical protein GCM10010227_02130 [Streptomyces gougerotii]
MMPTPVAENSDLPMTSHPSDSRSPTTVPPGGADIGTAPDGTPCPAECSLPNQGAAYHLSRGQHGGAPPSEACAPTAARNTRSRSPFERLKGTFMQVRRVRLVSMIEASAGFHGRTPSVRSPR